MPRRKEPRIPDAILDQLLAGADAKTAFEPNGLIEDLKKALAERVLNAAMDHHLAGEEPGNRRNGYGKKTVITDTGRIELAVPRDREARFDPQLIAKSQRRFPGFDDKVISMYARGMSTREIVGHLRDLYGIEVSPDLISAVTDAVLEEVAAWQARPLEAIYPLVFFDALRVKIRDEGRVAQPGGAHRARRAGRRHPGDPRPLARAERGRQILAARHERAEKPRRRGCAGRRRRRPERLSRRDHRRLPAGDGSDLHRSSAAPQPRFGLLEGPQARGRRAQEPALAKAGGIYRAIDAAAGETALTAFEEGFWGQKYPAIGQSWRRAWGEVVPFYAFPGDVRRILYTTNAIEALNSKLRRAVRARGHFPSDEAATKLLFLVLNRSEKEWIMPPREWCMAKAQFAVLFGERFTTAMA